MKNIFIIGLFVIFSILLITSCSEEQLTEPQHEHFEAYGIKIMHSDSLYMQVFNAKIDTNYHQSFELVMNTSPQTFTVVFLDEEGKEMSYPDDLEKKLGWVITDTNKVKAKISADSKWAFELEPKLPGNTTIEIRLNHIDHPDFKTPLIPITIK